MAKWQPYPSDVMDKEWGFVAPYLMLMKDDSPQCGHSLREVFTPLRWVVCAGNPWCMLPTKLLP
jgi:transposase